MAFPNEDGSDESDSQNQSLNVETGPNDMIDDRSMDSPPLFKKKEKEEEMIKLQELLDKEEQELKYDKEENKLQELFNEKEQEIKNTEEEKKKLQELFDLKEIELKKNEEEKKKLQESFNIKDKELKKTEEEKKKLQELFDLKEKEIKKIEEEKKKLQELFDLKETELKKTEKEKKKPLEIPMWCFFMMAPLLAWVLFYVGWLTFGGHQLNHLELRVMLVGKTGAGKSASGNTILEDEMFRVESSPASVTATCERKNKMVNGKNITVIDTPGVLDTWLTSSDTAHHAPDCISRSSPDPHVFLLVIRLGRFTVEERNAVKWIQDNFGEEALKFTMVLFTGGDLLEGKPIENFISNSNELQDLVDTCGGRYHVFNNYDQKNRTQVAELLEKIDTIIHENMGYIHSKVIHQEVQQKTREEEEVKRAMMENQFRLEEKIKWKQLKEESISECNNIALQIRQEEEGKRKQFEENIKAEKSRKLNEMAMKLRDEQYKNSQLTKEKKFWYNISFWCVVVIFICGVLGCTVKTISVLN